MFDIVRYFEQYKGEEIYYIANPGNGGDSLIALGTYHFFKKYGINIKILNRDFDCFAGKTVVYGGGGNIGKMTNFSVQFLMKNYPLIKKLIILPHTLKEVDPLLEMFGDNVDVICRELKSYDYVCSFLNKKQVFLSVDMAFHMDIDAALVPPKSVSWLKNMVTYILSKLKLTKEQPMSFKALQKLGTIFSVKQSLLDERPSRDVINCFRIDGEATGAPLPEGNVDLSDVFELGVENPEIAQLATYLMLSTLKEFKEVRTDRLHVAIGSALLGVSVKFYGNNYFKSEAVYNYSLKKNFPNVTWSGTRT